MNAIVSPIAAPTAGPRHEPRDAASAPFTSRHIGPRASDAEEMLSYLGYDSLEALVDAAVPADIRQQEPLDLPEAMTEAAVLEELRSIANRNVVKTQMLGQGFFDTVTPPVVLRKVLENPAWYTAYTPYQPEISQGRLEALLNFQTMVADLTGLEIANASLLDEASAAAEAVLLMHRGNRKNGNGITLIDADLYPQTRAVVEGRAQAVGLDVRVADLSAGLPEELSADLDEKGLCGILLQQPGDSGKLHDHAPAIAAAKERGGMVAIAADLLSLALVVPPGEQGADIAIGNTQRFGVPLFFGGPHAAYMAVHKGLERQLPGRLVGVSQDAAGRPAYRLALQTREQHIRREKATSNICTAQALLAITASMFAVYHGPEGIRAIAEHAHRQASRLAAALRSAGFQLGQDAFFDTLQVSVPGLARTVVNAAEAAGVNLRFVDAGTVGISCDETTTDQDLLAVLSAFGAPADSLPAGVGAGEAGDTGTPGTGSTTGHIPAELQRSSEYMTHPVFNTYRSETQMLRYLKRLSGYDLALDRTMIPLGSCTMKLNATAEMESISWPEFCSIHPFAPDHQTEGWRYLLNDLEEKLAEITGYAGVSIQPNAGSQGEYAGLLAIRQYHLGNGEGERDICLIPASAHGTNAASAVLAGLKVIVVKTAEDGTIDSADLDAKLEANAGRVAAIMITYPSTHGVYDADVREVCRKVHDAGGQVYIDGANLNALVGLAQPGRFGGDVSHLNLHKTFCIPHGGGGPGVGPVAVAEHLKPFLPSAEAPITSAPYGSAGVMPISWAYLHLMGPEGLTDATRYALLNANYLAKRLGDYFPVLYTGKSGLVAHECILDLRELTARTGVTAEDVCKRLIDYGFHAPTLAFPVAGTLMVEPTESEDLAEIERFIEAMIAIHGEMEATTPETLDESVLRNAPHTASVLTADEWERSYSRSQAAWPVEGLRMDKYFAPVGRIDGAWGDRNLFCSCPPVESFEKADPEAAAASATSVADNLVSSSSVSH
ncbi:aminomethyl-transferring glycine dehydrogenase [Citricoccus sp. SGAir0253]|uniref:aminomethyl-transferring glycine dehydrogenase n=1 Tax=Citricoccus sp. SGAir0253 TaxID=2567881 RepID=UPI0010CCF6D2|nr:aminomethyl-transferring glycine dehydrogenase [Citricoccus sp. SGAir0253]QCU78925.1 aminomethyl-transferring glycine dehydrogenase [Citricoccus sp. SGAir0253]